MRTHLRSGNVLFLPGSKSTADLVAGEISARIGKRFGFEPAIIVRMRRELARAAKAHPFEETGGAGDLYVGFLDRAPSAGAIGRLDPARSPGAAWRLRRGWGR